MAKVGGDGKTLQNIEALTTEFADELALLNTKVTTLEGTTAELKKDVDGLKGGEGGADVKGLGFTAFASFGLISTDKAESPVVGFAGAGQTRWSASNPDSLFFTLPQVSIGVDKEVNPGVYFHAQIDYCSDVNKDFDAPSPVQINEAYFMVDEIFGDIGAKVGAFALPMSAMEINGPFRTCNYTITPSIVNTINESWRGYGLEFQKVKDVEPDDIMFKVGLVSGLDRPMFAFTGVGTTPANMWTDRQFSINQGSNTIGEKDDSIGYYLWVGKDVEEKGFGWNFAYFANGGDNGINAGPLPGQDPNHTPASDVSYWQIGFEWWGDKIGVLGQYLDGEADSTPNGATAATKTGINAWYLLVNFEVDEKNNVTLRYDDSTLENNSTLGVGEFDLSGFTFAFNHKVTENSMFQFEYLTPDDKVSGVPGVVWSDQNDDLVQLRYKVHF